MKKILILIAANFFTLLSFAQVVDPGVPGPLAVTKQTYDLGDEAFDPPTFPVPVEVTGSVHYPTSLSDGPYPVIVLLHGRHSACYNPSTNATNNSWPCGGSFIPIPSYDGYDFLAEHLASHGYIVISVSANAVSANDNSTPDYGMQCRAELIQHHLDLWNTWNTAGGGPFGSLFVGKLDLTNIGTLGHSRGGEGVITHALHNEDLGRPYGVNAVFTLAPVDFNRPILTGIPVLNMAPYCDGDVSDLQGVHFYDDARYLWEDDTTAKYNLVMMGSNHNYYNTVWTPATFPAGAADDWGYVDWGQSDAHCGSSSGTSGRLTPSEQQNALLAYASAFFRYYIGGETEFAPILQVDSIVPPASSTITENQIFVTYHPPYDKRVGVNLTLEEGNETSNTLSESVSQNGLVQYDICGDDLGEQYCMGAGAAQQPHQKMGSVTYLGLSQIEMEWNSPDDWWRNDLPVYMQDLTQFKALQFRVSVNFDDSPIDTPQDFQIELTDLSGASSTVLVSDYSTVLYYPPGDYGSTLPRVMANAVKIPLSAFSGVDLTEIEYIRFLFNETPAGTVLVSDLMFSSDDPVAFAPIANFVANVTTTCSGEINFTDESDFNPTSWLWDFGDGTTSTDENPTHIYTTDGTYTVTLTVTNDAGTDVKTETSYIVVDKPDAPVIEGDTVCAGEIANLIATGSGGTLNWFDAATGGTMISSGGTFSPSLTSTTSYYVEEVVESPVQSVGPVDNTFGSGSYFGANDLRGLFFDAYAPFILESVKVYAGSAGVRKIQILDGDGGTVIHSGDFDLPAGESVVTLNWSIDPYVGYYMKVTDLPVDLFRINDGSPSYPYTIPGLVSLTGSNVSGTPYDFYYFFFDWKVREPDCVSERIEVIGVVDGPAITVSSDVTITAGSSTTLSASGGVTYSWSPATGLDDATSANPIASPTTTTTYTVTVSDAEGCSSMDSVTVTVLGQIGVENKNETVFNVYPNPTNSITAISGNIEDITGIEVYSVSGQVVQNWSQTSKEGQIFIDLSELERGTYMIHVHHAAGNEIIQIIKQ